MKALEYFQTNFDYFVSELGKIVSYKSISTDPAFKDQIQITSAWIKTKFESLGFHVEIVNTSSNPVLIAQRIEDGKLPTVLLYGHYDVQPVEPVADWLSDPFVLTKRDGKFFARGIMDNKGQFMMHVSAIESMLKADGKLPVNIKFIIEGDEETGSPTLITVIKNYAATLTSDFALISDGEIIGDDIPVIEASFRGVMNCEITAFSPREDMHSGVVGGAIANPAFELASLIAKFYDENYKVTIPHFYDDVEEVTLEEKDIIAKKHGTDEDFLQLTGAPKLQGESGYSRFELTGLRPTLQVTGLTSGYSGVGFKNIVPAKANAKFNFRLVANQDPQKVYDNFVAFIKENISNAVRYEISEADMVPAVKIDIKNKEMQDAKEILKEIFHHESEINFVGGTLPVIIAAKEYLHIPILSIPLSQEDCGMHSPNERLTENAFKRGVEFSIRFLQSLAHDKK